MCIQIISHLLHQYGDQPRKHRANIVNQINPHHHPPAPASPPASERVSAASPTASITARGTLEAKVNIFGNERFGTGSLLTTLALDHLV
ncbi:hypothetical protein L207DRAFT_126375 [Hyaloscypha variabilis F]|uniref:Uncharacterized protein n=1 Tax=Hyaloscypha variabilis (strain UAMH 11265 / GT02V1 / F) TaxID=1149755 RepID=A0A2J6R8C5_HYAVF|nr:hypothetical protein L207DRAFT_126375 [Hyaloscypha variabilis F]